MTSAVAPRSPEVVMRLDRMGSFHQCRLSFMRILLRRLKRESWTFERRRFDIDADGVGTALYTAHGPYRSYTLVAFGHDLPSDQRSDRVIATAWDTTYALHDGIPTDDDVERLRANVPLQEAGQVAETELTLSRANRSVRLFSHVVDALASGTQPDAELIDNVGYLMRTTAVYGSGKFGAADRSAIAGRIEFTAPFQVEMLTVYLIRTFVMDLVEHMAALRSPDAVTLDPEVRRRCGIGNSTGLGMAPFLLTHPRLINNWISAREEAIARVRNVERATPTEIATFMTYVERAGQTVAMWTSEHPAQQDKLADLAVDMAELNEHLGAEALSVARPWDGLLTWSGAVLSLEGQELLASLVLEPYGELVDDLEATMHADESKPVRIDGARTIGELRQELTDHYDWALNIDWGDPTADARAWYVSEEKLEPRLGERREESLDAYEQPLQPGRDAARLYAAMAPWQPDQTAAEFLRAHPEHRHTARRLQMISGAPYGEIRDNTISADVLPIDLLRAKLSFFGATRFDPRSDRWVRINMFSGAPFPTELSDSDPDAWTYPVFTSVA